jgi:acetyl esterase/lipase
MPADIDAALVLLPADRAGHPAPSDLALRREQMAAAQSAGTWTVTPPPEQVELGGRRTLMFRPQGRIVGRMLHLHGGAFRLGAPEMEGPLATALAARCGVEIIAPQYRLAPEHPFPAGLRDAFSVLCALAEQNDGLPLIVSGDSAGGGLAAGVTMLAIQAGVPIAGLVLLSPWLDLTVSAPSYAANAATDPMFSRESAASGATLYLEGLDARHPLASPLFGVLSGFPRTLISVGSGEVLADDARRFHAKLQAAGVESELSDIPGMEHIAVVRSLAMPGAAETFDRIVHLINDITTAERASLDASARSPA